MRLGDIGVFILLLKADVKDSCVSCTGEDILSTIVAYASNILHPFWGSLHIIHLSIPRCELHAVASDLL